MNPTPVSDTTRIGSDRIKSLLSLGLSQMAPTGASASTEILPDTGENVMAQLFADLQQPVVTSNAGPTSFTRLTGLKSTECSELADRTFLEVLIAPHASVRILQAVVDYGELLCNPLFPGTTRATGGVIRVLGLISLAKHSGRSMPEEEISAMLPVLDALSSSQFLPKEFRDHAGTSRSKIVGGEFS